jgi:hypothetical protein
MKILFKKGKKSYGIKIPLGAVKLIPSGIINHAVSSNRDNDSSVPEIDFKQLKNAVHLLKEYKGLKIIEVTDSNGEGVEIVI